MDPLTLPVSEVFDAWQGEGPYAGRRCTFIRLGLCNLHCTWCDTPYTWDHERFDIHAECPPTRPADIAAQVSTTARSGIVVLTGGEPMIHATNPALRTLLVDHLPNAQVHVETNGTLMPTGWLSRRVSHWSISPKVNPQGDTERRRLHASVLSAMLANSLSILKVVCATPEEVAAAAAFAETVHCPINRLWIMPEGVTPEAVLAHARLIADSVTACGANLTLRQHILMYGDERKR